MIRGRVYRIDPAVQDDPEYWAGREWAWEVTDSDVTSGRVPSFVHLIDWGYNATHAEALGEALVAVDLLRLVQQ